MDKKLLRKLYLEKRNTFSESELDVFAQRLTEQLFNKIIEQEAKSVFVFLPIPDKKEFNTYFLIQKLWEAEIEVSVPISNFTTSKMLPALFSSETELVEKKYGILEPKCPNYIQSEVLDLAVVPLLISDSDKNRVGYGGGFYDRFLGDHSKIYKLGVSFFEPIDKIEGLDKNDVQLDEVVF